MEFEGRKKIDTNLNIAPLIDVVFQLLIFFMLSASFIAQPGIKLTLPSAVTSKPHPDEDITVFITEDNNLYLNEEGVTLENLLDKLRSKILETEKKTIVIKERIIEIICRGGVIPSVLLGSEDPTRTFRER